jgi:predicted RNase H-like nuclease (RuvC/YqgF family)
MYGLLIILSRCGLLNSDTDSKFITLLFLSNKDKRAGVHKLTLWHEIEDLQKKKAELEFQLRSLEEKEKTLEERARLLEEKLAIKELEQKLRIKTESIEKLESRIGELEQRLNLSAEVAAVPELERQTNNTQSENSYHLRKLFSE